MFRVSPYVAIIPVCLGVFVAADDQTVMVTVLPDIMFDFRIPPIELDYASWTITAYLLGYVAAMPLIGSMSDAFGHRRMFAIATVFFMLCSVVAALSPSLPFLIGIRVFQAVGAGAMLPIAIAVVGDLFPRGGRGLALGIVGASAEAGGVIGPLWGGLVARFLDWPWVFWMNLPLGALVLIALFLLLGPSPRFKSSLDYVGGFFIAVALASLTLGLSRIDRLDLGMLGLLALTAVALAAFIYRQRTAAVTLLPNSMFRSRTVVMANLAHLMVGVALIIGMVTIPIMTTYLIGHSPLEGGLRLMRMTVAMPFGAVLGGLACQRIDYRIPSVVGLILVAIGYGFMTTWDLSVADPQLTIHLALAGLGFGPAHRAHRPGRHRARGPGRPRRRGGRGHGHAAGGHDARPGGDHGLGVPAVLAARGGIPMPVPQEGEAIEVSRQRVAEFQETLTNIGMDVFVTFFAVAAVVAALGILPAILMTWNRARSREIEDLEASDLEPEAPGQTQTA